MDEVLLRRMVGLVTLAIGAFLLSWLLPRPGLERLQAGGERVVTMDLTRPDSLPQERIDPEDAERDLAPAPVSEAPRAPESAPAGDNHNESGAPTEAEGQQPQTALDAAPAAPEVKADPKPEPKPEAKPEPKPAPKAETKPEPKLVASPPTPAASKPATASGSGAVAVQAGAFSHLDKAEGVRARAASQGVSCAISPVETAKGTLYRLRCGPYADRATADGVVRKLTSAGIAAQVVGAGR